MAQPLDLHRETSIGDGCDEQYRLAHHTPEIKIFPSIEPGEEERDPRLRRRRPREGPACTAVSNFTPSRGFVLKFQV